MTLVLAYTKAHAVSYLDNEMVQIVVKIWHLMVVYYDDFVFDFDFV